MSFSSAPYSGAAFSDLGAGTDIDVAVTGVALTASLGNIFSTINGLSITSSIGVISVQGDASIELSGLELTSSLGSYFTTNIGLSGTTSVGTPTVIGNATATITAPSSLVSAIGDLQSVTGDANVDVTGVELTSSLGDYFTTLTGVQGTTAVGNTFESTSMVGLVSTVGNTFESLDSSALNSAVGSPNIKINVTVNLSAMSAMTASTHALQNVTGDANVYPDGIEAIGSAGQVFMWSQILPYQNPNYSTITPSQTPNWTEAA